MRETPSLIKKNRLFFLHLLLRLNEPKLWLEGSGKSSETRAWRPGLEGSGLKARAQRLRLEGSGLKAQAWRLRLEGSGLKAQAWRLGLDGSGLKARTYCLHLLKKLMSFYIIFKASMNFLMGWARLISKIWEKGHALGKIDRGSMLDLWRVLKA